MRTPKTRWAEGPERGEITDIDPCREAEWSVIGFLLRTDCTVCTCARLLASFYKSHSEFQSAVQHKARSDVGKQPLVLQASFELFAPPLLDFLQGSETRTLVVPINSSHRFPPPPPLRPDADKLRWRKFNWKQINAVPLAAQGEQEGEGCAPPRDSSFFCFISPSSCVRW